MTIKISLIVGCSRRITIAMELDGERKGEETSGMEIRRRAESSHGHPINNVTVNFDSIISRCTELNYPNHENYRQESCSLRGFHYAAHAILNGPSRQEKIPVNNNLAFWIM